MAKKHLAYWKPSSRWTYRGIEITIDPRGNFQCEAKDRKLWAATLDTLRLKIDSTIEFPDFRALKINGTRIDRLHIIGIAKTSNGRRWVAENGDEHWELIRDTPENRKAAQAYVKARNAEDLRHSRENHRIEKLQEALPTETVE